MLNTDVEMSNEMIDHKWITEDYELTTILKRFWNRNCLRMLHKSNSFDVRTTKYFAISAKSSIE